MRKPFFRKSHNAWYIKDSAGRFHRLHENQEKAFDIWHRMSAETESVGKFATFLGIADEWLNAHDGLVSERKFLDTARVLRQFITDNPGILVRDVSKSLVAKWLKEPKVRNGKPKLWSAHFRHDAGAILNRVLRWAYNEARIPKNPLAGMRLESPQPRNGLISDEDHRSMVIDCLSSRKSRAFGLYLIAAKCGARPQQIREVASSNVGDGAWVFQNHKTRHKTGKPLVVYLSPCLETLTRILQARRPDGPLFLNDHAMPWKKDTVSQRMRRLRRKLGLDENIVAYSYRHTFATDSLLAGNSIATVASLLGHTSTAMVARVYGHLDQHTAHLKDAVVKVAKMRASKDERT